MQSWLMTSAASQMTGKSFAIVTYSCQRMKDMVHSLFLASNYSAVSHCI